MKDVLIKSAKQIITLIVYWLEPKEGLMARGGFREGAGRKKEYNEPVKKILLGLPESVLKQLDSYATANNLSRPKAVAILVEKAVSQSQLAL